MPAPPDTYGLGLEAGVNSLSDHNLLWRRAFLEEAVRIRAAVGPLALAVEHHGSRAVEGLRAKPIVDLMIGVAHIDDGLRMIGPMQRLGYDHSTDHGIAEHHVFGRPAARAYLAHVVVHGGDQWRRSLRF